MSEYLYRGARSAVIIHEEEVRRFIETWKRAMAAGVVIPPVHNIDYTGLDTLLGHVLHGADLYLTWSCEQLGLPVPDIGAEPEPQAMEAEADEYADRVLASWRDPLREVPVERFYKEWFTAPWGTPYCIDSMIEHAIIHPMKHRFQLEELMGER